MVAYSFAPQFAGSVATLSKRQTVRGFRKRHARPGELIQLYAGMRTKYCRKLVDIDPIVVDVREISIRLASGPDHPHLLASMSIEGVRLSDKEIEDFAVADGFGAELFDGWARQRMGAFWAKHHPWSVFRGVVIRWKPHD